jgi:hypothetical protein
MARKHTVCEHEPHHAKGLCRPCFDFFRKQAKTNIAPPDVPDELRAKVEAAGSLVPREDKRFRPLPSSASGAARQLAEEVSPAVAVVESVQKEFPFNTADPAVAQHIAGAVAKSLHDFRAAAKLLRSDLAPAEQAALAHNLELDPNVKAAVQRELEKLGLSETAKEKFFTLLWSAATDLRPQAERDRLQAWRLLARGFGLGETPSGTSDLPQPLPIRDLNEGLERMGLGDEAMALHLSAQTDFEIDRDTRAEIERQD